MPKKQEARRYLGDHPRVALILALIAFAVTFSAKSSVPAVWCLLVLTAIFVIGFVYGEDWFKGHRNSPKINFAISFMAVLILGILGWWLTSTPKKDENQVVLAKLDELRATISSKANEEETRPGFSIHLLMKLAERQTTPQCSVVEYGNHERDDFRIYVDSSLNELILEVRDSQGAAYRTHIPLSDGGVPVEEPIYIAASYGIATRATYLTISVDGKEMGRIAVPKQLAVRPFATFPGSIGATATSGSCLMTLYTMAVYDRTLAPSEIGQMLDTFKNTLRERRIK